MLELLHPDHWQLAVPSLLIAGVIYGLYRLSHYGSRAPNLPPGPPTVPVVGNLLVFPKGRLHLRFTEWGELLCYCLDYT